MSKVKFITKNKLDQLPKSAGVYLFFARLKPNTKSLTPIYIGKAINIKSRVKNHFFQPSYRDNLFMQKVSKIGYLETNSEIDALVLEAKLIKKYLPKFNVTWRDDKNYFFVAVTKDGKPIVYLTHQKKVLKTEYVGPFVEGNSIKKVLKHLRRVFPFYTSKNHPKTNCGWCHLGLCPGPSPDLDQYKKNIKKLVLILKGKRKNVLNSLKSEMKAFSNSQEFENAAKTRNKIIALEQVMAHSKVIEQNNLNGWENTEKMLRGLLRLQEPIERIECYDVSNIQGKSATGSMVVFKNGKPDKSQYRKFKIKMAQAPNDIAMLKEILERRFKNIQWPYPEVILIDGGIGQLNVAIKVKSEKRKAKSITIISIAKGRQELFIEGRKQPIPLKSLPQEIYNLIKHLDDEAHRFAISYHKKLRRGAMGLTQSNYNV